VFGVRQSLVADWTAQPDGTYRLDYDFVLNPSNKETRTWINK
jgi:hydroxyquinol 1,2-dioxygenase